MTRINSNVPSLIAQSNLARTSSSLSDTLSRLSTGLRINRGADDPAGLIVSERLRSELRGIEQGIANSERASNVIATTEGSLTEVSDLLNSIKALVVEAANTGAFSPDEIAANQLQVDSAIESITRISNTASFAGLKLLNGELGYTVSGVDDTNILKHKIFGAAFFDRASVNVDVEVLGSAQTANLYMRSDFNAAFGGVDGTLPSTTTLEIAGPDGVIEITFVSGQTIDDVVAAINTRSGTTGVTAARVSAADLSSGIVFSSTEYGSDSFVSVRELSGGEALNFGAISNNAAPPAIWGGNVTTAERDNGKDVVVLVNGAVATGRGLDVLLRSPELDLEMTLDPTFAETVSGTSTSFDITGGGSLYQLGPIVNANQQVNVGVGSIAATRLGGTLNTLTDGSTSLQFLSSLKSGGINELNSDNLSNASNVLETAIEEVAELRGRLGSFERNVLQTNIRSLRAGFENITAAESVIRDADFAAETADLSRLQVLQQAGTSVLATANTNAQNVLTLLG